MRSSGWSLEIGRIADIPIRIHLTFVILLVWFGFASASQGAGFIDGVAIITLIFGCVAAHELGHALTAKRFGVETQEILLLPIGGVARLRGAPSGVAELLIALAGPLVNLVLAIGLLGAFVLGGGTWPETPEGWLAPGSSLILRIAIANLMLFAFNLLPAFPMDGGRILRALLSLAMEPVRATRIAALVGQGFALLFALVGVVTGNVVLMLIALFVFFGAGQEAVVSHQQAWLRGRPVADAMISRFERLAPQETIGRAAQLLLRTTQDVFPVIDAWGRASGLLSREEILRGLDRHGQEAAVLELSRDKPAVVDRDQDLGEVLSGMTGVSYGSFLVADDEEVVGLVTPESVANLVAILSRIGR